VTNLDLNRWDLLSPLLDHPSFGVRDTLVHQLAAHIAIYRNALWEFVQRQYLNPGVPTAASMSALRSALRVYQVADCLPGRRHHTNSRGVAADAKHQLRGRRHAYRS
jgi:hypothetical protein